MSDIKAAAAISQLSALGWEWVDECRWKEPLPIEPVNVCRWFLENNHRFDAERQTFVEEAREAARVAGNYFMVSYAQKDFNEMVLKREGFVKLSEDEWGKP